jgi:hypothetical protein
MWPGSNRILLTERSLKFSEKRHLTTEMMYRELKRFKFEKIFSGRLFKRFSFKFLKFSKSSKRLNSQLRKIYKVDNFEVDSNKFGASPSKRLFSKYLEKKANT